ncbi:WYL domain-containing protein [Sulfurovum sp. bin170]|uniref:WYL domain-containing protein n=1 Tax=Sulfurovum sp. bin170 TaxID=2695268 RepID=UPI0013E09F66|nr:WYL domain-containing protein [Sulfurovum sp. bin170]NEW59986.1 WYL domain-containing protein [Sulfurovum sp. bin170]
MAKVAQVAILMELLYKRKKLKADDVLAQELGYDCTRTLSRHLDSIVEYYDNMIKVKKSSGNSYEFISASYIFEQIISNTDDLNWLLEMVHDWDSSILGQMYDKSQDNEKNIFLHKNSPFEELKSDEEKVMFRHIQIAILDKRYQDISYVYDTPRVHEKALCLKLIFMEQNWYLAIVDQESGFRFLRVSFIIKTEPSKKSDASNVDISEYDEFFRTFQNPFSLYDKPKEIAHIVASPKIAKYFEEGMKSFFDSQQFIEKREDNSVEFSVEYTQPMEILPFVKRWLPDLEIVSPQALKDGLRVELENYLNR